jgi:hypothetical protein
LRKQEGGVEETGGLLMDTLDGLREEYDQVGIGPDMHELLAKIVWSTVRQYPASEYSPYRTWDHSACEDVLNDWITERLWGRADLQNLLSSSATVQHLRAALTTSLRQHLTNKRRRSIVGNLYKRVRTMLRNDSAFRSVNSASAGPEERWMLVSVDFKLPSSFSVAELAQIACELNDDDLEVVRYGPFSQKLSPILRDPKLREFLIHLLQRSKGTLTLGAIIDVMRLRFSLPTDEVTELDEGMSSLSISPADEAAMRQSARTVVSRLTTEETDILERYFRSSGAFLEAARLSHCDVQQVRDVVHRAFAMISECSDSEDEARAVMQTVESLLNQHGDR